FSFANTGAISLWLGLRLEKSLFIAALRCIVQLTIMGYVLEDVFRIRHPALVIFMACVLIFLGTYEIIYNKAKRTYNGMFLSVLVSMGASTMLVGVLGSRYAMNQIPFWEPVKFIPSMGMLLGNCMSGMAVGISTVLTQLRILLCVEPISHSSISSSNFYLSIRRHTSDNKDKVEMSLSYGATRWEAGRPIMIEAIRLAMLPTINQMSVIGLIAIPGMMTGQIIGGAPVMDAVKYQQIIMFMISASTGLGVVSSVVVCLLTLIDNKARLRPERIQQGRPHLWHDIKIGLTNLWHGIKKLVRCGFTRKGYWDSSAEDTGEWARLLS
ncbi:hypothetical protein BC936DRAFT_138333, partial [Jimgerdemannia flammicorona]